MAHRKKWGPLISTGALAGDLIALGAADHHDHRILAGLGVTGAFALCLSIREWWNACRNEDSRPHTQRDLDHVVNPFSTMESSKYRDEDTDAPLMTHLANEDVLLRREAPLIHLADALRAGVFT